MAKIGRNDPCPCGSGKKYKKCCFGQAPADNSAPAPEPITVTGEVAKIQAAALARQDTLKPVGVFIFFSTAAGDAWLLEVTGMDAIQLAAGGETIAVEIDENPETIEINWSHKFVVEGNDFITTAYADKAKQSYSAYPAHRINTIIGKIKQSYSEELLKSIHVE